MNNLALGIDIGGTNTAFGLVNRSGEILKQGVLSTRGHATVFDFVAALKSALSPLIESIGIENLQGIGIGAPNGNIYTGEIVHAANLDWKGRIPLAQIMQDMLGLKTHVTNDANAATIGEMKYGAAKGMKDFILLTLGTGLGSGFVANGQLIYGHDGFAGELGHVRAVPEGRLCGCGRKGCLERYASANGIVSSAQEMMLHSSVASCLREMPNLTAASITQAARAGDQLALELFEFTGAILGTCLADAVAITSPEAIILFGGLSQAGALIFEPTQRHMEASMLHIYKGKVKLLPSSLPDADAAILGASALVW
ncbi:MAG: ROK family protein [Bacteroidetes bacterium]|nr:ROK family protein [Bacteroidota bacterium]MBS1628991.1 ROK family protein [Bacteroidota bacterium]